MNDAHSTAPLRRNVGVSIVSLIASSGTLVCCVLPAAMVSLGAGAVLAGWVSAVPQLIWLSLHKASVFATAGAMLLLSGALTWRARGLPCPSDPALARSCLSLRRWSVRLWFAAAGMAGVGAAFAFVVPWLRE